MLEKLNTEVLEAASIVATMTTDIEVIFATVLHDTAEDNINISLSH